MASQQAPTVGSRVVVSGGKKVGTVKSLVTDGDGQRVVALAVEHGVVRRRVTQVPMSAVKWVNPGNVVLTISAAQFEAGAAAESAVATPEMADDALEGTAHH